MSKDDVRYFGVMFEEIRDQNRAVLELLRGIPTLSDFQQLEQRVDDLQADVKIVKAAVTDQSHQLADHEHRMTRLEAA